MEAPLIDRRTRPSSPDAINDDLAALWREVGRDSPVARAMMANLIVLQGSEAADVGIPLDAVVRRHPSRVVVLRHAVGRQDTRRPSSTSVAIATFGQGQARYGVEEIFLQSACADVSLPSIVRRVTRGDVPSSIWWTEDFSRVPPIASLFGMVRQVVYDSRGWRDVHAAIRALRPVLDDRDAPQLADVNWRRLTSMRYAIVHAARTMLTRVDTIRSVEVRHRPGEGALASLLVGWLAARLRWPEGPRLARIQETGNGDEVLTVTFEGVTAAMSASRIFVHSESGGAPFQVAARQESDADAVVGELNTLAGDRCLHDALTALARAA
ncbi:MAG TPA: glucose-6-phosphate dehydrogenase assembly protein OpcA [Vicinamibacterales bacterium]|jgi:glucose-6-phosphate dehydrogenase assembly protein OpcA